MRIPTLLAAWNRVFFKPQSPASLGLYRIFFGTLVALKLLLMLPDWTEWYGGHAWVSLGTMNKLEPGLRIDVFDLLPQTDAAAWMFFAVALCAAIALAFGFMTRISSVLVFFALVSMDERELYAMNSGDTFLRVTSFFLMFAPTDAAFSVDRLLAIWRGKERSEHTRQVVWAQRVIQFLVALVYLMTAWWKATGPTWVDGTALYYVQHLNEFQRFPTPRFLSGPLAIKIQTWVGLAEEFALGTLVWIKELRYWILGAGVVLHLTLEYTMNVPLFQWIMMSTFILFIDPEDLRAAWRRLCVKLRLSREQPLTIYCDQANPRAARSAELLKALDVFGNVHFTSDPGAISATRRDLAAAIPVLWPAKLFLRN